LQKDNIMKILATFDQVVDAVVLLPTEQQEMLVSLIHGWHIEKRRHEIARDAHESLTALHAGKLKPQSAETIIRELRQSLEEDEL